MVAQASLTELDLSDNAFGPAGMEAVTALLTSPTCFSLKVLKFNNTGMGIGGGKVRLICGYNYIYMYGRYSMPHDNSLFTLLTFSFLDPV